MFGVLELRGDFRLVQEAHKRVGGVEYHFQGDGALGGGLARTEDRARAALCDDHADAPFFPQKLLGQRALHHRGAGRERHVGGLVPRPPQLARRGADLDFPVRPQARAPVSRTGLAVRRRAAQGAEVLDEGVVVFEDELRVLARNEVGVHTDEADGVAPDGVVARREDVARVHFSIHGDENVGLWGTYRVRVGDVDRFCGRERLCWRQILVGPGGTTPASAKIFFAPKNDEAAKSSQSSFS
jgi:hypothetical protein